jgi:hypothetical protein
MQLFIDGAACEFVPIKSFRAEYNLPPAFSVALFEPKDYAGLGRIDRAGSELNDVRRAVLDALPERLSINAWLTFLPQLEALFRDKLVKINAQVGLREVEIDFAVAGFGDVCRALLYALLRARAENRPIPTFIQVYAEWLNSTIRVSQAVYIYEHEDEKWRVQIVNHAYGRIGICVQTGSMIHYVHDGVYGCPAEGYMVALLTDVAAVIVRNSLPV